MNCDCETKTPEIRSGRYRRRTNTLPDFSLISFSILYFGLAFIILYVVSLAFNPSIDHALSFYGVIASIYSIQMTFHRSRYKDSLKKESIESQRLLAEMKSNLDAARTLEDYKTQKLKLESELKDNVSYNQHLSNVISGINHEISPWIGGISNMLSRLNIDIEDVLRSVCEDREKTKEVLKRTLAKHAQVFKACDQSMDILTNLSMDIKKIKNYSISEYNLRDTITSWVRLILMDRKIKESIGEQHIIVDEDSLDFIAKHSPMLVSQIILNLAKNTVEHNSQNLENIQIKIYGDAEKKCLIYEDNGIGMKTSIIRNVFTPGFTTKSDKSQHGFGLAACYDYCLSMGALIRSESTYGEFVRFTMEFGRDSSGEYKAIVEKRSSKIEKIRKKLSDEESNH